MIDKLCRIPYVDFGYGALLLHAALYYGINNRCFNLGKHEVGLPCFPVRFRHGFSPLPTAYLFAYVTMSGG